ncbi:N-acyl-D-amino-acid deacylase family protein [Actinopolymorpha singaporensis]|uniref:N-acyl-D-amino-acid deacylase n=1 Tax=Actinopolymorpha singaporensis TaxID=117157 RepID=A0A1H1Y816_9ACTN|nr:D-aminoacylase [Actinopolymorpha singaporensis]SDT17369.1 N-acyl-D-amino-acid deacylase [Actinopolymorpha singaporensis]
MYDVVLAGGTVLDGTGAPGVVADVAVEDGRIAFVGRVPRTRARRRLDVTGAVVCPGFVDLHSHADFTVFGAPGALTQVAQGVTTLVTGNCGFSPFPVVSGHEDELRAHAGFLDADLPWDWSGAGEYAAAVERLPLGVNLALQVGHGAVRVGAMGVADRAPTPAELDRMRALVSAAVDDGVVGLSSGLIYAPASYARAEEMAAVAEPVAAAGRLYSTHIRDEGDRLDDAVEEALEVGRRTGVRVQVSHLKAVGPANWGRVGRVLETLAQARRDGVDAHGDQYPYTASSTTLTARLPGWAMDGGVAALRERLERAEDRDRLVADLTARTGTTFLPERIVLSDTPDGPYRAHLGSDLATIARAVGRTPAETAVDLLRRQRGVASIISHGMAEDDVRTILADPAVAVASDGWILDCTGAGTPHPRSFGTFARVLGHYVRDGVLDLPTAVAKMTSLPAARLGWRDRGVVRPGAVADLAVFDPDEVADPSSYDAPWQLARGVSYTLVAGTPVWENGAATGAAAGRVVGGRR